MSLKEILGGDRISDCVRISGGVWIWLWSDCLWYLKLLKMCHWRELLEGIEYLVVLEYLMALEYLVVLENDCTGLQNLVFDWFPLILGRWFRIRSPFWAIWSEFCNVARFVFFRLENQICEIFENLANFFWKLVTYSWRL